MKLAEKYYSETKKFLTDILSVDSPTGFSKEIVKKLKEILSSMGYQAEVDNKNVVSVFIKGESDAKKIATSAHVDTLGLMVRSISSDGKIMFTRVGGPILPTLDSEYCKIYTRDGRVYTGTILSLSPSVHVFEDSRDRARNEENMYIRLDEEVSSKSDVLALGIENGCFIAYDTKTFFTASGYIKSRFLDDKAGSSCLLTVLKILKEEGIKPAYDTTFYFTNYEEVGHGAATVAKDCDELVAVDMGCIGKDLSCSETDVSICAKDSHTPYDYDVTNKLISIAKKEKINYAVDIYPMYGSDVGASYSAGNNVKGGLIGPGVAASHGMERTHKKGVESTVDLLLNYLMSGDKE